MVFIATAPPRPAARRSGSNADAASPSRNAKRAKRDTTSAADARAHPPPPSAARSDVAIQGRAAVATSRSLVPFMAAIAPRVAERTVNVAPRDRQERAAVRAHGGAHGEGAGCGVFGFG